MSPDECVRELVRRHTVSHEEANDTLSAAKEVISLVRDRQGPEHSFQIVAAAKERGQTFTLVSFALAKLAVETGLLDAFDIADAMMATGRKFRPVA